MVVERETPNPKLYIDQKGWAWRLAGEQFNIQVCPLCDNKNWKFFVNKETGQWDCKVCGRSGNLWTLAKEFNDDLRQLDGPISSVRNELGGGTKAAALPDIDKMHDALLEHEDALEYLQFERGYSLDIIKRMKLGVDTVREGKTWIVYPFFHKGKLVYAKWRTLPPLDKDFRGVQGREQPLYNEDAITPEMEELFFVEGEGDTLAMLDKGITGTVGVPGANSKKLSWIEKVDEAKPKKKYLLYDTDKVGQHAAQEMAKKLGIGTTYNIVLPAFEIEDADGGKKAGKDINEWFRSGHTIEEFEALKKAARPFDVAGVKNVADALQEAIDEDSGLIEDQDGFDTPWVSLNPKLGRVRLGQVVAVVAEGKVGKTTFVLNWLDYLVRLGYPSFLFCLEMRPKDLAKKWATMATQIPLVDDKLTPECSEQAKEVLRGRTTELQFGWINHSDPKKVVFDTIRDAVRRYNLKVVAFDNLHLLSRSETNKSAELDVLSKQFKQLAMELDIAIILIVQPNRVGDNDIVSARNIAGTSAVEKDCDSCISLHRAAKGKQTKRDAETISHMDVESALVPDMRVSVDLARYAPGGITYLYMDGATSTVREMDDKSREALPKRWTAPGNTIPVEEEYIAA